MNQEELMVKFQVFEKQINELQQQISAIDQGIMEIGSLKIGLDELNDSENNEIMAQVGRGMFVKAKILDKNLLVDIGNGNFVKKSPEDAKKIIDRQTEKLENIKREMEKNLENIGKELTREMQESQKEKTDDCKCGPDCSCEDGCKC